MTTPWTTVPNEETTAQRSEVSCSRSHSREWLLTDSNPGRLAWESDSAAQPPPLNTRVLRNSLRKYTWEENIYIYELSHILNIFIPMKNSHTCMWEAVECRRSFVSFINISLKATVLRGPGLGAGHRTDWNTPGSSVQAEALRPPAWAERLRITHAQQCYWGFRCCGNRDLDLPGTEHFSPWIQATIIIYLGRKTPAHEAPCLVWPHFP